jgi:hypothetical protein
MANDKDFKVKNGVKASAYYEAMGTVTSSVDNVGPVSAFSTDLYTGDATTSKKITNNIDLSTDGGLVWIKRRSDTSDHRLMDTERGASSYLASNTTDAASTGALSSFDTDGFTIGNASAPINANGSTYVAWSFKKQSSFFDAVTYTGDGTTNRQISHSLGTTAGMCIVKRTDSSASWFVWHRSTGDNKNLELNDTTAASTVSNYLVTASSTTFTVGNNADVNASGGTYVAYLFAHDTSDDSYIQCGSYTGNNTTGNSVTLGWEPQWLLIKNATTGGTTDDGWWIVDKVRGLTDLASTGDKTLQANTIAAEDTYSRIGTTSTGFELTSGGEFNQSGDTYIYIAIREATSTNKRTLDLSTGSVFEVTADADVQIGLSNPAPSGTVSSATLILNGGSKTTYDIANLKGANEKANLSTLSCQYPDVATSPLTGVFLSTDGDKLYTTDDDTYHVYQYNILRPPYLDSAVLSGDLYVGGTTGTQIDSLFFKPDGTKMYQLDKGNDAVYQWDLSTAWEISTAAYNSKQLSVASQATLPAGLWFKSDGSSLYVLDETTDDVFQYDLTTAWDVSTGSYASKSIDETAKEDGIIFNSDGTKIFIGTDLEEYNLSTAWDISTASASGSTAGGSYNRYTEVFTLSASSTGKYLYYSDRTRAYPNKVYGHTSPFREQRVSRIYFGTAYDISYDSSIKFRAKSERSSFNVGETRVITFTTRDGGTTYMAQEVMKGIDEDV